MVCWIRWRKRYETIPKVTLTHLFQTPSNFCAFGFGSGLIPFAPGTFGTLIAIPIYLLISGLPVLVYSLLLLFGFLVGIHICSKAAESLQTHDHPAIVWDEVLGYLITMYLVPFSLPALIAGFLLFRFFDIVKPWPIKLIDQRVQGGFGIMVDDVIAAVFAAIVLRLIGIA